MVKQYLKQAWQMMKQQKLFSTIYILGTALAVCFTLVMLFSIHARITPNYPEYSRLKLYKPMARFTTENRSFTAGYFSHRAVEEMFRPLQHVEALTAISYDTGGRKVQLPGRKGDYDLRTLFTDTGFFQVFNFDFLEGSPFTDVDFQSGLHKVVITDQLARRVFGSDKGIVGKEISIDYVSYQVCGVVKSASILCAVSYAQAYMPYTTKPGYERFIGDDYMGEYAVYMVIKNQEQMDGLMAELHSRQSVVNLANDGKVKIEFNDPPVPHSYQMLHLMYERNDGFETFDGWKVFRYYLYVLMLLLIVPAINLSGMISSRMEDRLPEMGVLKTFGASRGRLLSQVLTENLMLTLVGGLVCLVLSWIFLLADGAWAFSMFTVFTAASPTDDVGYSLSAELMFSPLLFVAVLLVCLLLNVFSALIPAWVSLRKPIVYSINQKE